MEKRKYPIQTKHTRMVNVRIPTEDYEDLSQIAAFRGCAVSSLIKEAIEKYLREEAWER